MTLRGMHDVLGHSDKTDHVFSPPSALPETLPDLLRSNSYTLTRGGKVISSRPWSLSDAQRLTNAMKRIPDAPRSSSSSESSSSSSSPTSADSSGDEKTHERGEEEEEEEDTGVRRGRHHETIHEEEELSEEDNDTDSEETENTVIARSSPLSQPSTAADPCPEPDEGDTLSSISGGDLSFEAEAQVELDERSAFKDRNSRTSSRSPGASVASGMSEGGELSPGKDEGGPSRSEEETQLSRSFEFHRSDVSGDSSARFRDSRAAKGVVWGRGPPETDAPPGGELGGSHQREGVFCLSGFPRAHSGRPKPSPRVDRCCSSGDDPHAAPRPPNPEKKDPLGSGIGSTAAQKEGRVEARPPPIPKHAKSPSAAAAAAARKHQTLSTSFSRSCENIFGCRDHPRRSPLGRAPGRERKRSSGDIGAAPGHGALGHFLSRAHLSDRGWSAPAMATHGTYDVRWAASL